MASKPCSSASNLILFGCGIGLMLVFVYTYLAQQNNLILFFKKKLHKLKTAEMENMSTEIKKSGKEKRLPGFIIAGVQKCGTQALATFLSYHPSLKRAGAGEVHFFDRILKSGKSESYEDLMPETYPWEIAFEKTPAYANIENISIISTTVPGVKIILQLCDPIERTMSDFLHARENTLNTGLHVSKNSTFESVVLDKNGHVNETCAFIMRGVYIYYIQKFLKYFPRDRILITDMTNLKLNPGKTLNRVETFLNITPFFKENQFYFNPLLNASCIHIRDVGVSNATDRQKLHAECLGALGSNKHRLHPTMNPETKKKLRNYFVPSNEKLAAILGLNYSWI